MPIINIEDKNGRAHTIDYDDHTPLRLDIAARIAFPDGSMGPPGLRKERDAGRLQTELIAGKEYVTMTAIAAMREACRGLRKGRSGAERKKHSDALAAALATAASLPRRRAR